MQLHDVHQHPRQWRGRQRPPLLDIPEQISPLSPLPFPSPRFSLQAKPHRKKKKREPKRDHRPDATSVIGPNQDHHVGSVSDQTIVQWNASPGLHFFCEKGRLDGERFKLVGMIRMKLIGTSEEMVIMVLVGDMI